MNSNAAMDRASQQSNSATVDMTVVMERMKRTVKANAVQESSVARQANASAKAESATSTLTVAMEVTRMIVVSLDVYCDKSQSRSMSIILSFVAHCYHLSFHIFYTLPQHDLHLSQDHHTLHDFLSLNRHERLDLVHALSGNVGLEIAYQ